MRRLALSTTGALSAALILTLGACSATTAGQSERVEVGSTPDAAQPDDPSAAQPDESASGEGDTDRPADWPPELPLPQGQLLFGGAGTDVVTANFRMSDMADVDRLFADFISAGFELLAESNTDGALARGFANDTYRVNISVTPDGDNFSLTYVAVPA